jgi:uncharacterized membrane protein
MNAKHMSIITVTALATLLVASTALATADSAFADEKKHKYEKSQAGSQVNDCGNGEFPEVVFCQNLDSQIQGDGNAVVVILEQR